MAKIKILILGGTKFIGRNLVELLNLRSELDITLFNRGASNPELFKNLKLIKGDRSNINDIQQLGKENWDVVIDLSGYFPIYLEKLLPIIEKNTNKIIFISSIMAYDLSADLKNTQENATVKVCTEELRNDTSWSSYGFRKAECERLIQNANIPNKIILRPAIAYGEHDLLDRFYYWIYRIKFCKEIIVPEGGKDIANYTYVKDLVNIINGLISLEIENEVFNVTTHDPIKLDEILQIIMLNMRQYPKICAISSAFLIDNHLVPRVDIPLWNNGDRFSFDNSKIQKYTQMNFFSFNDSIGNTIDFYKSKEWRMYSNDFLSIKNEKKLIRKYNA